MTRHKDSPGVRSPVPLQTNAKLLPRALDSDDTLALYHDQDSRLKAVFDSYCKASDRAGAPAALGVLLNIAEFRMILRDSGLLGGNNKVAATRGVNIVTDYFQRIL